MRSSPQSVFLRVLGILSILAALLVGGLVVLQYWPDIRATLSPASSTTEICNDGVDNDGDGLIDMEDPDCSGATEICNDGVDNDRDGLIDMEDPDCGGATTLPPPGPMP